MVDTKNITAESLQDMSASEVDALLRSLQEKSQKKESVSQGEDILRGLRRVPGILAGIPGDIESIARAGINYVGGINSINVPMNASESAPAERFKVSNASLLPTSEDITKYIQENTGIDQTPPETPLGRIASLVGTGGVFGLGRGGLSLLKGAVSPASIAKPVASETLAAAGAGGAGELARASGAGNLGQFGAEIAGGTGIAGLANLLTRAGRNVTDVGSNIIGWPNETIGGVKLPKGGADIASDILREATYGADPTNLRRSATQTVADQLDSVPLKSIEKSLSKEGGGRTLNEAAAASERARAFNQSRVEAVANELRTEGKPEEFISGVRKRMQEFNDKIAKDIASKGDEVSAALENVGTGGSLSVQSVNARNAIENSMREAKQKTDKAWAAAKPISDKIKADATPIIDNLNAIIQAQPKNISPDRMIPGRIVNKIRNLGEEVDNRIIVPNDTRPSTRMETLTELQAARSDILDEIRTARTDGRYDQARKLGDIQESMLKIIEDADTEGLLKAARVESRAFNDTFHKGQIGKTLGLVGDAEDAIPSAGTLDSIMAPSVEGLQGTNVSQFIAATGKDGEKQAEDFLRSKFQQAVVNEAGDVNLGSASSFLRNNRGALDVLPALRREIEDSVNTAKRLERQIAYRSKSAKAVNERSQSAAIINASPDKAIAEALKGKPFRENSKREINKLFRLAKTAGQRRGLTRALFDYVADQSLKTTQDGARKIDFNSLNKNLEALAKSNVYKGPEFSRIKRISDEMRRIANLEKRALNTSTVAESGSMLTDIIASFLGARAGASIGGATAGGSIQTAGRTAGLARKLVAKLDQAKILSLLEEAIYDPDVFRTLISRNTSKGDLIKATKLRGYMLDLNNDLPQEEE